MRLPVITLVVALSIGSTGVVYAQDTPTRFSERFPEMAWLIGEWQGYGAFTDRTTYLHRTYEYDVAGMFLVERTVAMFPPDTLTVSYEVHQDFAVYYLDTSENRVKSKTFFVESFVQSSTVTFHDDGKRFVVESVEVENGPPGMRARFTIERDGEHGLKERFELAMPGEEYKVMERIVMRRIR